MYAANFRVNNDLFQSSIWRIPICPCTAPEKKKKSCEKRSRLSYTSKKLKKSSGLC